MVSFSCNIISSSGQVQSYWLMSTSEFWDLSRFKVLDRSWSLEVSTVAFLSAKLHLNSNMFLKISTYLLWFSKSPDGSNGEATVDCYHFKFHQIDQQCQVTLTICFKIFTFLNPACHGFHIERELLFPLLPLRVWKPVGLQFLPL